jgi:alpha-beta hydrolase superfamily lysophospholipase
MSKIEFSINSVDSLKLYGNIWTPEGDPLAVICLVHGLGEHIGRYHYLAEAMNRARYAVLAVDLRGHGRSAGARGHTPQYEDLLSDVGLMIEEAQNRFPKSPLFLYGHSLGGNIVLNYCLREESQIDGAVVTAPSIKLGFDPPAVKIFLGNLMNTIWPTFTQASGLETAALSRDPQVVERYINDPLVHDRVSARLFVGFYQAGLWALQHASELRLPTLIMQASADRLVSCSAAQEFADQAGSICDLKIWPDFYHEIHNEPEKDLVIEYAVNWLDHHLGEVNNKRI